MERGTLVMRQLAPVETATYAMSSSAESASAADPNTRTVQSLVIVAMPCEGTIVRGRGTSLTSWGGRVVPPWARIGFATQQSSSDAIITTTAAVRLGKALLSVGSLRAFEGF